MYGKETVALGAHLTRRHLEYAAFLEKLHSGFIESIFMRNDMIRKQNKEKGKTQGDQKERPQINVVKPGYANKNDTTTYFIADMEDVKRCGKLPSSTKAAKDVHDFLQNTKIRKLEEGELGVSWLELYTLLSYCYASIGQQLLGSARQMLEAAVLSFEWIATHKTKIEKIPCFGKPEPD